MNKNNTVLYFTGERFVPGIDDKKLEIEHYQRYYSVLEAVKNKVVLDVACGEGYGSNLLASKAKYVYGIDINSKAVSAANKKYGHKDKLLYQEGNIANLPVADHSIDIVISFETIEHVSEEIQKQFLEEIVRVLKKDGILIMSTPNKSVYSDLHDYHNEFHIKEFYKDEFENFLKTKFSSVEFYHQYFEVASIIDNSMEGVKKVPYYSDCCRDGKYYIAVATNDENTQIDLHYMVVSGEEDYNKSNSRILQLQCEVEERNSHLKKLDLEIEENRKIIDNLRKQIIAEEEHREKKENIIDGLKKQLEEKECVIKEQEVSIKQLSEKEVKYLKKVEEQESLVAELKTTVCNKEDYIKQLLEVERRFEREKSTRTYRLALKFRKISSAILPENSKRCFFAKLLKKALRHPGKMIKMINPKRIKNCMIILRREGVASAYEHLKIVEDYERSRGTIIDNSDLFIRSVSDVAKDFKEYKKLEFPQSDNPEVSIIIPVYNQFDYTYHCLESILENSFECSYEVIIGNDCSTDLTKRLEEIVSGIRVITNNKNLRFLLNCNHAAESAKGKYILFLNNDTQVQKGWLQSLIYLMEQDATIGMVGSKLLYPDGYLQEAGGILWKDASAWNYGNRQNPNNPEFNYVREVDYISGAAIMIRRSLWEKIGGFDTRFGPAYCEDSDLAFEVRRHGYKVVYQPKSVVVHFEGISNGTDLNAGQKKYQVENQKKFYEKWKNVLEAEHFENGRNVLTARERSKNKKHILVIDHYVPQYDKDAGSKTTWMYLKMLVKKGYQITFLGDNFYQHEPYTTELQQLGICVLYGPKYAENWKDWLLDNIDYFDIFYLNRPHISIKYIDLIKAHAHGKIIYYGHDLHFLRIQREYEVSKDEKLLDESQKWLDQEIYLMRNADMSYYPSVIEKNAIQKIDASIPVKAITAYVFETFNQVQYDISEREGILFVGGFAHGPNLDAVLWFLENIYPQVYERTKAPFYIVGSKPPMEIQNIKTEGVVVKGFVSEEELKELYKMCRIAVVPLRYGAGVKGKVVEALYYGIPVVTTSVGAEGISGIEEFAVVKDKPEELVDAICSIYNDQDILSEMSEKNQVYVQKYFSVDAVWNIVKDDFK